MAVSYGSPRILNTAISGLWFGVEDTQGTSMSEFTADGWSASTPVNNTPTTVSILSSSGARDNDNISAIAVDRFVGLQVVFEADTATSGLQKKAYNISASTVPNGDGVVTLTVDNMDATPANSGTSDTFKVVARLPATEFVPNLETDILERDFMRDTLIGPSAIAGNSFASGSFEMEAHGLVTALGDAVTPVADRYSLFLETFYGTRNAATGTNVTSGNTTTITVASVAGLDENDVVVINNEARIITDITGSVITISPPLSASPSPSDIVYGTESFTPFDTAHTSGTLYVKHDDRLTKILGCLGSIKLSAEVSGKAMYTFDFKGEWDNTQTAIGAGEELAGYQLSKRPVACRSFRASHFGTTSMILNKFEYDHTAEPLEIKDGEAGYRFFIRSSEAGCAVTTRYQNTNAKTWQTAGTLGRLLVVTGNSAGDWVGCHGLAFVSSTVGETEINKNVYNEIPFKFYDDQDSNDDKKPRLIRG